MENQTTLQKAACLSGFTLKRIAVLSMLIDHFGSLVMDGVIAPYQVDGAIYFTAEMPFMVRNAFLIKAVCEILGSIAFPLFCFLMTEGFLHTRNRLQYAARLGVFALLSEIPYDLAHYHQFFCFKLQNVLFTLCVGLFTLLALAWAEERFAENRTKRIALCAAAVAAGMGLAFLLRGEYVFLGVLSVSLFYLLRKNRWWQLLGFAALLPASPWVLLAAPPVLCYNHERGKGSKYFFYIFYPAHFLVFAAIAALLAGRAV